MYPEYEVNSLANSKEIDLDLIYKQVIKRLFDSDFKDYQLIRADEISGSEIIDVRLKRWVENSIINRREAQWVETIFLKSIDKCRKW